MTAMQLIACSGDVEMKGTKLETVLESIFVKSGFSFVIEDGVVIIREAGKKQITAGILPQSRKLPVG